MGDTKTWIDLEDFATAFFVACSVYWVQLSKADVDLLLKHFAKSRAAIARRQARRGEDAPVV